MRTAYTGRTPSRTPVNPHEQGKRTGVHHIHVHGSNLCARWGDGESVHVFACTCGIGCTPVRLPYWQGFEAVRPGVRVVFAVRSWVVAQYIAEGEKTAAQPFGVGVAFLFAVIGVRPELGGGVEYVGAGDDEAPADLAAVVVQGVQAILEAAPLAWQLGDFRDELV